MRQTQVQSLGQEDPLNKEMATHSSTLTWKIPWMEERGRLQSKGLQRVGQDWATSLSLYTWMFFWQNSIRLCPALFHTPSSNLPVTPGVSWLPTFAFQSPIMKRTSFLVLVLKGLVGLHKTIQLQLLQLYWLGHRLGLPWHWMVRLGDKQRSFCHFWDCIQVLHFRLFCWPWWLLHFFWGIPAHSSRYNGHLS